jgi:hypothetical protein
VLFDNPILGVKGNRSFWEYPLAGENIEFKPGFTYTGRHIPSGESWLILGIDIEGNRVCAAGWPPSIGKLSDCIDLTPLKPISAPELDYRKREFGTNWI